MAHGRTTAATGRLPVQGDAGRRGRCETNEKQRQARSRAVRSAMFSLHCVKWVEVKNGMPRWATCAGCASSMALDVVGLDSVTPSVTTGAVTGAVTLSQRHGSGTANQNQNHNHIKPPPPAGGAGGVTAFAPPLNPGPADRWPSTATPPARPAAPRGSAAPGAGTATGTATALCGYFPGHRRTRLAEVGTMVASLEADGTVTGEQLLKAAGAQQAEHLSRDNGKACPSVLRWLREQRWLDGAASVSHAGAVPADWRNSRSGIEAMGVRLGLGPWDQGVHRLLSQQWSQSKPRWLQPAPLPRPEPAPPAAPQPPPPAWSPASGAGNSNRC